MTYRCPICAAAVESTGCANHPEPPLEIAAGADPLLGATIADRFVVLGPLGRGGMGVLYRAWQMSTAREVAIKVLDRLDEGALARFRREARVTANLSSPHVVTVLDTGALPDDRPYLVMELLRGDSLAETLKMGPLLPPDAAAVGAQICLALAEAHAAGVVHRDLKPGNIMLETLPDGRPFVRVLDFGLAKFMETIDQSVVTHANATPGTPAYMSPEQIRGQTVGPGTDLYAVGLIVYELVCGRRAYPQASLPEIFTNKLLKPPPTLVSQRPRLAALSAVIDRCLARELADRPSSAEELRIALERLDHTKTPVLDDVSTLETDPPPSVPSVEEPAQVPVDEPAAVPGADDPIVDPANLDSRAPGAMIALGLALALGVIWAGLSMLNRPAPTGAALPDALSAAPASPIVEVPTSPATQPSRAPASAPVTVAPASTATAAPSTAAAKAPATRKPKPKPTLQVSGVEAIGLSADDARATLRSVTRRAQRCSIPQIVRASLFVAKNGSVKRAQIKPSNACLKRHLAQARFPAPSGGFGTVRARIGGAP